MDPTTRPGEMSTQEAAKFARALLSSRAEAPKAELHNIILSICGCACLALMGVFAWIAIHVITQQDDTTRRLATVEAKLDILLSDRHAH